MNIAIQKKGKLTSQSLAYLRAQRIVPIAENELLIPCANQKDYLLAVRDDDIPGLVESGYAEAGIVGENVLLESGLTLPAAQGLGFGKCKLCFAAPAESKLENIRQLEGKTIATSHPHVVKEFLRKKNVRAQVVYMAGSVEVAPKIGLADVICDLVVTGTTMRTYNLRVFATILESQAMLIATNMAILRRFMPQTVGGRYAL